MCGIIISSLSIPLASSKFVKKRGPDLTNKIKFNNINFEHYLLSLCGKLTKQPVIEDNILCIFNGEIYNYKSLLKDSVSDIFSIVYCYKKYGEDFVKYLDGEFVIIIFDFNQNKIIITSDIFKTKPLFYEIGEDIIISSYESACMKIKKKDNYNQIQPNEILVFSLNKENNNRKLLSKKKIFEFNLLQYKSNYNDFIKSLENSILKRYPEKEYPLVLLSSGLDSGVIACCLNKYKRKALYISIIKNEDYTILKKRRKILGKENHYFINLNDNEKKNWSKIIKEYCEKFYFDWRKNINMIKIYENNKNKLLTNGYENSAMLGTCKIINKSKNINNNIKVICSGVGADEIMSRNQFYSKGWGNVDIFPDNLSEIYPWPNFFSNTMTNYLRAFEYIGGLFSYEIRYPFLDKNLVQEFLSLQPHLKNNYKNSIYKPPLLYYLDKENFPIYYKKVGFNV
jgi:asparagine synthetase B (glutamine-hydrolysing)